MCMHEVGRGVREAYGEHLGRIDKRVAKAGLSKVNEPQRAAHVDEDVARIQIAVLLGEQGLPPARDGMHVDITQQNPSQ